jgi:hypothetical protein
MRRYRTGVDCRLADGCGDYTVNAREFRRQLELARADRLLPVDRSDERVARRIDLVRAYAAPAALTARGALTRVG